MLLPSFTESLLAMALAAGGAMADMPHFTMEDEEAFNAGAFGFKPNMTYHTVQTVSPRFLVRNLDVDAVSSPSHIFLAPALDGLQTKTPMIFDAKDLSLVYADPGWNGGSDTRLQTINGTDYITFWSGAGYSGWGSGGGVIVDNQYKEVYNLTTVDLPTGADSHEFHLTGDATALLNNYHGANFDLTAIGGPEDGLVHDCAFQEVDIATGELLYEWKASDHFDFTESYIPYSAATEDGWDWFHNNAIQKMPDSSYLISSRHLCMVALVNGTTGDKIWQIGGKSNDFEDLSEGRATSSCFQHDARLQLVDGAFSELTLFDNHAIKAGDLPTPGCEGEACTRGLRLRLDFDAMTAEVIHEFYHPAGVSANAQGGYQALPGGGAILGYGTVPAFTEFNANGDAVMDVQTSPWSVYDGSEAGTTLYRAYKFDWSATPDTRPAIAVVGGTVYASWNGATTVKQWMLRGGASTTELREMQVVTKQGFETGITPGSLPAVVQIDALDVEGNVMATTQALDSASGKIVQ